jgi:hypothetical protein
MLAFLRVPVSVPGIDFSSAGFWWDISHPPFLSRVLTLKFHFSAGFCSTTLVELPEGLVRERLFEFFTLAPFAVGFVSQRTFALQLGEHLAGGDGEH